MCKCVSGRGNHRALRIQCNKTWLIIVGLIQLLKMLKPFYLNATELLILKILRLHLGLSSDLLKCNFLLSYFKYQSRQFCTILREQKMRPVLSNSIFSLTRSILTSIAAGISADAQCTPEASRCFIFFPKS